MILLEKYKQTNIADCVFNIPILKQLIHMATYDDIPHIIISGPPGSGKKTLVNFFLENIYDSSINDLTKCKYAVSGSSAKKNVEILRSDYHIIIEPTNTNHDKYILQEIIKQYAMNKTFSFLQKQRKFKTIVILNIENLSSNSQSALRRTMELYAGTCRFVMICNNLSKIFDPLKSRCRLFCVPLPSRKSIQQIMTKICVMENLKLSSTIEKSILNNCEYDLKKVIWTLDIIRHRGDIKMLLNKLPNNTNEGVVTILLDYVIDDIVKLIMSVLCPRNKNIIESIFMEVRTIIYSLIITNIDGSKIMTIIMNKLLDITGSDPRNDELNIKIIRITSECEYNLVNGRREITPIDCFVSCILQVLYRNRTKLTKL